ncbi:MAG: hypothetical protein N3F03_07740 [Ignavibacteria bacterium]|nr:hypothetical protein [Ignavibacteria bacterium]
MKKITISLTLLIIFSIALVSCSEIQSDITPPAKISIHKEGVNNPASPNFHGKLVKENNWDLKSCQQCHAANYSGGTAKASCLDCHRLPGGPEACNTCHGDFTNPYKIAPPRDLNGNISESSRGVGSHIKHLDGNTLGNDVECSVCHIIPRSLYDVGHIDSVAYAEVIFSGLAVKGTSGLNQPRYKYDSLKCANTYCHGNFSFDRATSNYTWAFTQAQMVGNNSTPIWNVVDGTYKKCNTCHGKSLTDPSPVGHINSTISACGSCHPTVVDNQGNIIDKEKHINGKINVFNLEYER